MKRNLKALGLLLTAVFAMSAMATSAAALEHKETAEFWADGYPATIDATGEKGSVHEFVADEKSFKCAQNEAEIAVHGTATLAAESKSLTGKNIEYTNCHAIVLGITFPVTVDMNGCDYRFTAGETVAHGSTGTVDIVCEKAGEEITITVFNNFNHDPVNNDRCVIHIPPQNNLGTITYTNKTAPQSPNNKKSVTIDVSVTKITSTITDTNKLGCNNETHDETGTYNGTLWAEGTDEEENPTDIEVT